MIRKGILNLIFIFSFITGFPANNYGYSESSDFSFTSSPPDSSILQQGAHPKADSLFSLLKEDNQEYNAEVYNKLASYLIAENQYQEAVKYGQKALELAAKSKNAELQHKAEKTIGVAYYLSSDFPNAIIYLKKAIQYYKDLNKPDTIAELSRYLGGSYYYTGQYQKAYEQFINCHEHFSRVNDTIELANTLGNIGNVYLQWREYNKALEYFTKALELNKKANYEEGLSTVYNNIANFHFSQDNYQKTIDFNIKSLRIKEELGDSIGVATSYNNIAGVYFNQEKYHKALDYYIKALNIYENFNDKKWMSMAYNNIGFTYEYLEKPQKALENYEKALALGKETNYTDQILFAYESFSEVYRSLGDYKNAFLFLEKYKMLNDSTFNEEKHRQMAEMEARFENRQKQKEIELLNKEATIQEEKLKKKNIVIYAFIFIILLLGLLVFFIWRSFNLKKKANKLLKQQNDEIKEKNEELRQQREEIEAQRDEIEIQRDKVIRQKNQISEVYKEINSSIQYASTIQNALLPPAQLINRVFPENFIFYRPKESVSGDFYWVEGKDHLKIIAVADCTGHGVPGAFLSVLGMTALDEIYHDSDELKASSFLNNLKNKVINALHQTQSDKHPRDSMEMSVCVIDTKKQTINFSGSYNPVVIIQDNKLEEIKADRFPVGYHPVWNKSFTDKIIRYAKGDSLYLFTDGFADQKNHITGKKYLKSRFKKLLVNMHKLPVNKQKEQLVKNFNAWKGNSEQIDDILVAGIKL